MDPGDAAGRIFFVLGVIWSSPSSPPSSPSVSPPPAAVDAAPPSPPSTPSLPAAALPSSSSSSPLPADPASSSASPLPSPPSSSSTPPPPVPDPFRMVWCYLVGRLFNFTWRASGSPRAPTLVPSGPTSAPSLPARRSPETLRRAENVEQGEEAGNENVGQGEEAGNGNVGQGEETQEIITVKGIEVAEERDKLLQKERERKERERISEKRKLRKQRRMIARLRRVEEKEKEEDDAIRRAKERDEARMAEEARKSQLADARRKAQEAELVDARRKAELAAARRKTELAAARKAKTAHESTSTQRMPALPEAKNQRECARRRAANPLQYRTYTNGITFKDVVLGTVTGKQQEDEMTQLAVAEEKAEPMSQSQEELKRSEVTARRMAIAEGKRPLLSLDQIPSEKQEKWINEERQQGTQEHKKKPREEVARAEEEHHGELYPDVLLMLGAQEWDMWNSPDVGDTFRSIFCASNAFSTLHSDDASTKSSPAQEEGSSSDT